MARQVLPNKLSELMVVALEDLAKTETSDRYIINMGHWHSPGWGDGSQCAVCFAGSVMAMSLGVRQSTSKDFSDFKDVGTRAKMLALNALRCGRVGVALWSMDVFPQERTVDNYWSMDNTHALDRKVSDYDDDPCMWHRQMIELAADLAAAGL